VVRINFKDGLKMGLWMGLGGLLIIPGVLMVATVVLWPFGAALIHLGARIGGKGIRDKALNDALNYVHKNVNKELEQELQDEIAEPVPTEEWE
jgi:hypothetical protein